MIRAKIKIIGTHNSPVDTADTYGLVYLDSDKVVGPKQKEFERTSYPEEEGDHIIPKRVDAAFDYKVKFFIQATSLVNANGKIAAFNSALYSQAQGSNVKEYKQIEFYNLYKRHKIVGYPDEISEATEFWRDTKNQVNDVVVVELTIHVNKPSLCNYNYTG